MKSRAVRRHHYDRLKRKIIKRYRSDPWRSLTPKSVGRAIAVHDADCSCAMCGNPRKYFNAKTMQEMKQDVKDKYDSSRIDDHIGKM